MLAPIAKKNGVDESKIKVVNVAPNLVEQLLIQGQVDVIAAFAATTYMNVIAQRHDPEGLPLDLRRRMDLDLFSNCVMVSQKLLKEKPEAVRGFVRAINRAVVEIAVNPNSGMAVLQTVETLLKPASIMR